MRNFAHSKVCILYAACVLLGEVGPASAQPYDRRSAIVEAIAKAKDSIVNVRTMRSVPARLENSDNGRVRGLGTGVIIDPRGYVVTNYHVIEKVDEISVMTANGRELAARVVCFDTRADLAILRIDSKGRFPHMHLYGAGKPILGETVIAIGNPYGLENSVSTGIVSAVDRELRLPNGEMFNGLIQTDASINPGNSGGPLININGDLLGIIVAIRSNSHGIGFAIPTAQARRIIDRMMDTPVASIGKHGLSIEGLVDDFDASARTSRPTPRIGKVEPGSPAEKLGFLPGDELVSVADQEINVRFDLGRVLWDRKFGEIVSVKVRRNGSEIKTLNLEMAPGRESGDGDVVWEKFGVLTSRVPSESVRGVHPRLNGGLMLTKVAPSSPAAVAGFQPGDILIGLNGWEMIEPNNIRYVMQWKELPQHQPIKYDVIRNGQHLTGTLQMPSEN